MKAHHKCGKKPGKPAYRTPSWQKNKSGIFKIKKINKKI